MKDLNHYQKTSVLLVLFVLPAAKPCIINGLADQDVGQAKKTNLSCLSYQTSNRTSRTNNKNRFVLKSNIEKPSYSKRFKLIGQTGHEGQAKNNNAGFDQTSSTKLAMLIKNSLPKTVAQIVIFYRQRAPLCPTRETRARHSGAYLNTQERTNDCGTL